MENKNFTAANYEKKIKRISQHFIIDKFYSFHSIK